MTRKRPRVSGGASGPPASRRRTDSGISPIPDMPPAVLDLLGRIDPRTRDAETTGDLLARRDPLADHTFALALPDHPEEAVKPSTKARSLHADAAREGADAARRQSLLSQLRLLDKKKAALEGDVAKCAVLQAEQDFVACRLEETSAAIGGTQLVSGQVGTASLEQTQDVSMGLVLDAVRIGCEVRQETGEPAQSDEDDVEVVDLVSSGEDEAGHPITAPPRSVSVKVEEPHVYGAAKVEPDVVVIISDSDAEPIGAGRTPRTSCSGSGRVAGRGRGGRGRGRTPQRPSRQSSRVRVAVLRPGKETEGERKSKLQAMVLSARSRCPALAFCRKVLVQLIRKPAASSFIAPVKELWRPDTIPNYDKIVKHPMDLATVRRRLDSIFYLRKPGDVASPPQLYPVAEKDSLATSPVSYASYYGNVSHVDAPSLPAAPHGGEGSAVPATPDNTAALIDQQEKDALVAEFAPQYADLKQPPTARSASAAPLNAGDACRMDQQLGQEDVRLEDGGLREGMPVPRNVVQSVPCKGAAEVNNSTVDPLGEGLSRAETNGVFFTSKRTNVMPCESVPDERNAADLPSSDDGMKNPCTKNYPEPNVDVAFDSAMLVPPTVRRRRGHVDGEQGAVTRCSEVDPLMAFHQTPVGCREEDPCVLKCDESGADAPKTIDEPSETTKLPSSMITPVAGVTRVVVSASDQPSGAFEVKSGNPETGSCDTAPVESLAKQALHIEANVSDLDKSNVSPEGHDSNEDADDAVASAIELVVDDLMKDHVASPLDLNKAEINFNAAADFDTAADFDSAVMGFITENGRASEQPAGDNCTESKGMVQPHGNRNPEDESSKQNVGVKASKGIGALDSALRQEKVVVHGSSRLAEENPVVKTPLTDPVQKSVTLPHDSAIVPRADSDHGASSPGVQSHGTLQNTDTGVKQKQKGVAANPLGLDPGTESSLIVSVKKPSLCPKSPATATKPDAPDILSGTATDVGKNPLGDSVGHSLSIADVFAGELPFVDPVAAADILGNGDGDPLDGLFGPDDEADKAAAEDPLGIDEVKPPGGTATEDPAVHDDRDPSDLKTLEGTAANSLVVNDRSHLEVSTESDLPPAETACDPGLSRRSDAVVPSGVVHVDDIAKRVSTASRSGVPSSCGGALPRWRNGRSVSLRSGSRPSHKWQPSDVDCLKPVWPSPTPETGYVFDVVSFAMDVRLCFQNCMLYNPKTDGLHRTARDLRDQFDVAILECPIPSPVLSDKRGRSSGWTAGLDANSAGAEKSGSHGKRGRGGGSRKSKRPKEKKKTSAGTRDSGVSRAPEKTTIRDDDDSDDVHVVTSRSPFVPGRSRGPMAKKQAKSPAASTPKKTAVQSASKGLGLVPYREFSMKEMKARIAYLRYCRVRLIALQNGVEAVPMTPEEKTRLTKRINYLPLDKISLLVQILKRASPQDVVVEDEELEVDLDRVPSASLREIEAFVDRCVRVNVGGPPIAMNKNYGEYAKLTRVADVDAEMSALTTQLEQAVQDRADGQENPLDDDDGTESSSDNDDNSDSSSDSSSCYSSDSSDDA